MLQNFYKYYIPYIYLRLYLPATGILQIKKRLIISLKEIIKAILIFIICLI